jgi:hypothetical protein
MLNYTKIIFDYIKNSTEIIDEYVLEDFKICIFKAFASLCGVHMAYSYLRSNDGKRKKLQEINEKLRRGV